MRKSKLDNHIDLIKDNLEKGMSLTGIHRELIDRKCNVAYETLRKWVVSREKKWDVKPPTRKKGRRPNQLRIALDSILPENNPKDIESIKVPAFFYAFLQNPPPTIMGILKGAALTELGIKNPASATKLTDLELCLVAALKGDLLPLPFGESLQEIETWVRRLINHACQVRSHYS